MPVVLLFTATTGYQARAFEEAASALGVDLVYATDRCRGLDDPWRDQAIPVRFHDLERSTRDVVQGLGDRHAVGVVAVGDRPAVLAAHVAWALGIPFHPPTGALTAASKLLTRGRLLAADLPCPWFVSCPVEAPLGALAGRVRFPCVVKPVALSASRGVIRADTPDALMAALERVRAILDDPDLERLRDRARDEIVVEGFVPGLEYALEGVMEHGTLHVLAVFAKPDPLDGPFFEETIYVTPPGLPGATERHLAETVGAAALAMGLHHGPIHAECRVNDLGVFVLEIAARPIGGLCARSLRFVSPEGRPLSLEALLLRHATGGPLDGCRREASASAVMMLPVPRRGHYVRTEGLEEARAVPGVEDVVMTAAGGQLLVPLPDGHSYPGFVFARAALPEQAVAAVREAHARLRIVTSASVPVTPG